MGSPARGVLDWLHRRAEDVLAALLGVMFVAFVVQIVFRYFFNLPIGWTSELTVVTWLWLVLWGSAFVLKEQDEIRFDLLYSSAGPRARRAMGIVVAASMVVLYALSLPKSYSYVEFMKVERAAYLRIRLDYLYSIYIIFLVAVIVRYAWLLWRLLRGEEIEEPGTSVSSGL